MKRPMTPVADLRSATVHLFFYKIRDHSPPEGRIVFNKYISRRSYAPSGVKELFKGHFKASTMTAMALSIIVLGTVAGATSWSPGMYGLGIGTFSWASQDGDKEAVQLSGTGIMGIPQVPTFAAIRLGAGGQEASQDGGVAAVQLGSAGVQTASQNAAGGRLQLSGYHDNMGSYTNVLYPSFMLGGTFGGGGGGCGC
jgi:hypothetical protein